MSALVTLDHGAYSMVIDPAKGARITVFAFNGKNALTDSGPQTGSTFWPSPQHSWGWPPPPVLDSQRYEATQADGAWVFTSGSCAMTGLVLSKVITPRKQGFDVEYRMHNPGEKILQYAPWEITRVDGGLTFYRATTAPLESSTLPVIALGETFWHDYSPAGPDKNLKLFANNSAGWLANANKGLLVKKTFPKIAEADIAPEEAEVEVYAHGDPEHPYVEIEQQGRYGIISPGETIAWKVGWEIAEIPEDITVSVGSDKLLKLAEAL
ncbi:MAG TPA: DUF4380 domain-containing protein [Marinagarivorans sp.]